MEEKTIAAEPQENKMGVLPVGPLLFNMAVPMMISMLFQALYNIVDSIFVGMLNQDAFNAVSLAFPLQTLCIAVGAGTGVGMNALLSRSLGEKKFDVANRTANTGIFLYLCSGVAFGLIGLLFGRTFFELQTANQGIIGHGAAYINICLGCSVALFIQICMERLLQSTGRTNLSMICQIVGAVTNIILDPIMIFGLLGCPAFGIAGAAYATIIGQIFGAVLGFVLMLTKNKDLTLRLKDMAPDWEKIKAILTISVPSILMSAVGSILTFILNVILIAFSSTAVAVYGVYFKLQSFIFMPIFGLNSGMVPIIAYNYGAGNKERIHRTMRLSMLSAVAIMGLGMAAFNLIPTQLLGMFNASEDMLAIGVPALKTISLAFVTAGICIISGSVCQAFGYAFYSLFTSIARQIVVLLPAIYLLSLSGDVNNIWWAWPIAEVMSLVVSLFLLRRVFHKTGMSLKTD